MIDRKTGCITLSATCQLKAGDAFAELSALPLGETSAVVDRENGWKWMTIKNFIIEENYFIGSFGFYTDALKLIELTVSQTPFDLTASWDAWSEEQELALLKELRVWLLNELGREGRFAWGDVRASYDPKGGYSSIGIHYR